MATITSISRATRLPKLARGSTAVVFLALLLMACAEEEEAARERLSPRRSVERGGRTP